MNIVPTKRFLASDYNTPSCLVKIKVIISKTEKSFLHWVQKIIAVSAGKNLRRVFGHRQASCLISLSGSTWYAAVMKKKADERLSEVRSLLTSSRLFGARRIQHQRLCVKRKAMTQIKNQVITLKPDSFL